jgi:drug/metabolite transporter (DMT)-like permease
MDSLVFAAVLCAAAAHAGWNAVIKRGLEPFTTTILISIGAGVVSLALIPFTGLPAPAAWPWVIASVVIHLGYFIGLIAAYRAGDMGQVYPIARGSAPMMTAMISTTWLAEPLGWLGWVGLLLLVAGVLLLSGRFGNDLARLNRQAVGFALFTAVTVCGYSIVDGVGGRLSGNASGYSVALFAGIGVVMTIYALVWRGPKAVAGMMPLWRKGAIGGSLQLGSYWVAIWAMTVAPIAVVAALRETSVLFGALLAAVVLKEPLRAGRIVAALLIVTGLVAIRLH